MTYRNHAITASAGACWCSNCSTAITGSGVYIPTSLQQAKVRTRRLHPDCSRTHTHTTRSVHTVCPLFSPFPYAWGPCEGVVYARVTVFATIPGQVYAIDQFGNRAVTEQGGLCTFSLNDSTVAVTGASTSFHGVSGAVRISGLNQ